MILSAHTALAAYLTVLGASVIPDLDIRLDEMTCLQSKTAPRIDGKVQREDKWEEATAAIGRYADGNIEIRAKHDGTSLFLLLRWDEQRNITAFRPALYFEDDGRQPDLKLDGTNDDCKYVGVTGNALAYRDAHWENGWTVRGEFGPRQSGSVQGKLVDGKFTVEFEIPLKTGDKEDISVSTDKVLGFAIVNWSGGRAGSRGAWPEKASPYKPATWGRLRIEFHGK